MKKNDIVLICLIALAAFGVIGYHFLHKTEGARVLITVGGKKYGSYDLSKDQTIDIHGTNTLKIKAGKAFMTEATCPDKLCVQHKPISKDGESIICLPNRVVVTIEGGKERDLDAVTN